jgi:hypothetical protein
MAYHISKAKFGSYFIREHEYATALEVYFTNFDTCIGVIVRNGNLLTAIHLSDGGMQSGDKCFDANAANVILRLLGNAYTEAYVVGFHADWYNFVDGYFTLRNGLNNLVEVLYDSTKRYGAGIVGSAVSIKTKPKIVARHHADPDHGKTTDDGWLHS